MSGPQTPSNFAIFTNAFKDAFAVHVREFAKESGTGCSMPDCDALTIGVRCEGCARRVCMSHVYWRLEPKPTGFCPYCVLQRHPDLFKDGSDDDDDGDVLDADAEETT